MINERTIEGLNGWFDRREEEEGRIEGSGGGGRHAGNDMGTEMEKFFNFEFWTSLVGPGIVRGVNLWHFRLPGLYVCVKEREREKERVSESER